MYYDFLNPSVNFFGPGCVSVVGERCKILGGKKALVVCDPFLAKMEGGPVAQTIGYVQEAGLKTVVFDGVEPNPKDKNVFAGLKLFKEEKCDMIITVGGGSAHDCGKGIGLVANGGN
ncbi:MAG TPA: 1,3-propanediol dehydrogenase, partial [Pelotomaculum sp.]|nr:1,3-propanediol dehydrogenase [Pelotomaculum sp.]